MSALSERAYAALRGQHVRRLVKFGTVSVISTVITQSVLFLTYDILTLGSAMLCNVIATAVSTVPAYWLNRTWTWGKRGKSHPWKEVAPFWVIAFVGLVLSTVAVGIAAHNADQISHSHLARKIFVQFANFFTYGCIWVGRYMIFNRFLFGHQANVVPPGEVEAIALEEHEAKEYLREGTPSVVPVEVTEPSGSPLPGSAPPGAHGENGAGVPSSPRWSAERQ
jgi:putative flippase GtrA